MKNECLDAALEVLREAGVHGASVARGGKHLQVQWQVNGRPRFYVVSGTPSDVRSVANTRADMRRMLRADGLLLEEENGTPKPTRLSLEQRVQRLEAWVQQLVGRR
jgi:hypothetical protein